MVADTLQWHRFSITPPHQANGFNMDSMHCRNGYFILCGSFIN
jgi:hypothetical protein